MSQYYFDIPENTVPNFETFYKAFIKFVKSVSVQGDQLFEMTDSLCRTVDRLHEQVNNDK